MTTRDGRSSSLVETATERSATAVDAPSLGRAARRGVLWSAVQTWTVKATGAATFVIVSRQLAQADYGLVAVALATTAILYLFGERSLATVLERSEELSRTLVHTVFWTGTALGAVLTLLTWAIARPLSGVLREPGLEPVLLWLSAGFLLSALGAVPDALLRRALRFKDLALRSTVATLSASAVGIVLALNGAGVWALVAQHLTSATVGLVLLWVLARWRVRAVFSLTALRGIAGFATQFTVIDVLTTVQDRGQELLISIVSGSAALGSWTVAGRFVRILEESGAAVVNAVAIPTLSRLQHDASQLHRGYALATTGVGLLLFPALLLLAVTSEHLVPWLLGSQWTSSGVVAQVLALTAALGLLNYFDRNVFIVLGRMGPEFGLMVGTVVAQLVVVVVFARHGLLALAVAVLVRVALTVPVRLVVLNRCAAVPFAAMTGALRVFGASLVAAGGGLAAQSVTSSSSVLVQVLVPSVVMALLYPAVLAVVARSVVTDAVGAWRSTRATAGAS